MRSVRTIVIPAALALASASAALAQAPPPPIGDIPKPMAALYYGVGFVLLAATILISIMPSKRRDQA